MSLKKIQLAFTRIAIAVALPFSVYFLLYLLLAVSLLPNWLASLDLWAPRDPRTFSDTFPGVAFYLLVVVIATLMNRMPRYVFFSLAAIFLSLVALAWLVFSEPDRNRIWRRKPLYVLSFSLFAVLLFPFLGICVPFNGNVGLIKLYFGPYQNGFKKLGKTSVGCAGASVAPSTSKHLAPRAPSAGSGLVQ